MVDALLWIMGEMSQRGMLLSYLLLEVRDGWGNRQKLLIENGV